MIDIELLMIVAPAFSVGIMIALTHAPLGIEVLRRGIIFMDLAIAQFAGLGLILAPENSHPFTLQAIALLFALSSAVFFSWIEKVIPNHQEAIIGSSFIGAASLSLLLLADRPHGGEEVQHLLSGQILFVTWKDLLHHLPVYAVVLGLWLSFPKVRHGMIFYALFALVITSSVQLVGVYVVFASLVLPALAVSQFKQHRILLGWGYGVLSVTVGIFTATLFDLPVGTVVVLSYIAVTVLSVFTIKINIKLNQEFR